MENTSEKEKYILQSGNIIDYNDFILLNTMGFYSKSSMFHYICNIMGYDDIDANEIIQIGENILIFNFIYD